MNALNIGLIGTGFMGRSHSQAFRTVSNVFATLSLQPHLATVADVDSPSAQRFAQEFGFEHWTTDWEEIVADPAIDLVDITVPNDLHKEIALAAAEAGKHIYCEKPLAPTADDARVMRDVAQAQGVKTMVGFHYLKNPTFMLAQEMIEADEIGEIYHVRSRFYQDVLADPNVAFSWRFDRQKAGSGALGDLGAHALAFARYLGGEIDQVCGMIDTFISERPTPPDDYRYGNSSTASDAEVERQRVENEDAAHALLRFRNKATGVLETSRVASGHKVGLDFEIVGSRGAIYFTHDRLNELNVYRADDGPGRRGFKTLMLGPDHPYYGEFWPVAGCGLGFGDLKTIEVYELLSGINEDIVLRPDFDDGWQVCRLSDAILTSAAEARWVSVDEIR